MSAAEHPDDAEKKVTRSFSARQTEIDAVEAWGHANHIGFSAALRCLVRFALANGATPDDEPDLRRKDGRTNRTGGKRKGA